MPEGPSVRRWGETARQFLNKKITRIGGTSKVVDHSAWEGAVFNAVVVYGKQFFFQLVKEKSSDDSNQDEKSKRKARPEVKKKDRCASEDVGQSIWFRYHFLMWGSLRANEYKGPSKRSKTQTTPSPRIEFHFVDETFLVFYGGSVRQVDGPCKDEGIDILSDTFDIEKATRALMRPVPVCYSLMDQTCFAGAGNIVKNEVLYACRTHPLELGSNLKRAQAKQLAEEVVRFTKAWMEWEQDRQPQQKFGSWVKMYWKFKCPDGHKTGRGWFGDGLKRMTTWCPECQALNIESEVAKEELANIGKIKSSVRVKGPKVNATGSDDDDDNDDDYVGSEEQKGKRNKRKQSTDLRDARKSNKRRKSHVDETKHSSVSVKGRKIGATGSDNDNVDNDGRKGKGNKRKQSTNFSDTPKAIKRCKKSHADETKHRKTLANETQENSPELPNKIQKKRSKSTNAKKKSTAGDKAKAQGETAKNPSNIKRKGKGKAEVSDKLVKKYSVVTRQRRREIKDS